MAGSRIGSSSSSSSNDTELPFLIQGLFFELAMFIVYPSSKQLAMQVIKDECSVVVVVVAAEVAGVVRSSNSSNSYGRE